MTQLIVNNNSVQTQSSTIAELAAEMKLPSQGVAFAIENKMIPRNEWETTTLKNNQKITILKAFCGG